MPSDKGQNRLFFKLKFVAANGGTLTGQSVRGCFSSIAESFLSLKQKGLCPATLANIAIQAELIFSVDGRPNHEFSANLEGISLTEELTKTYFETMATSSADLANYSGIIISITLSGTKTSSKKYGKVGVTEELIEKIIKGVLSHTSAKNTARATKQIGIVASAFVRFRKEKRLTGRMADRIIAALETIKPLDGELRQSILDAVR
ncbi:MAG: hypothetical protein WCT37_00410 [Patescibacteria group bacterium]|jgi:hypothetical protein